MQDNQKIPRKLSERELDALESAPEGADYMLCDDAAARLRYLEQRMVAAQELLRRYGAWTPMGERVDKVCAFLAEGGE